MPRHTPKNPVAEYEAVISFRVSIKASDPATARRLAEEQICRTLDKTSVQKGQFGRVRFAGQEHIDIRPSK